MKIDTEDKKQPSSLKEGGVSKEAEEAVADAAAAEEKPVDYRYVRHGQGPCDCCGPHSE